MPVTILELAQTKLGHVPRTGPDFSEAGFDMIGGCQGCHATIAAYNAYPSRTGYWQCEDCIGDLGFETVEQALAFIFA